MASSNGKGPLWWDRDTDRMGRLIRADVRAAAHEIWNQACARARGALGDDSDAAEMMEISVENVSHYLDSQGAGAFCENTAALLTVAFRRQVQKHRIKKERMQFVGGASDLEQRLYARDDFAEVEQHLHLNKIIRRLSQRSRTILLRRRAGVDWKSISEELGIPQQTAQNSFWHEVKQVQKDLLKMNRNKETD